MTDPTPEQLLDAAYRERAHLVALLAAHYPAVTAPAPDTDEGGWVIAYLTIGGHQASWHISPRDLDLFGHVTHVPADDPRAQWDGHTTDEKYWRIRWHTQDAAAVPEVLTGERDSPSDQAFPPTTEKAPTPEPPLCGAEETFLFCGTEQTHTCTEPTGHDGWHSTPGVSWPTRGESAADDSLRERYHAALREFLDHPLQKVRLERATDAVLAVRDRELEQERAENGTLRGWLAHCPHRTRAEQAEELLTIAHQTSNTAEAERAKARAEAKRLGLMVDEYGAGAGALTDKIARVRELHRPYDDNRDHIKRCVICVSTEAYPNSGVAIYEPWPCPTLRTLDTPPED